MSDWGWVDDTLLGAIDAWFHQPLRSHRQARYTGESVASASLTCGDRVTLTDSDRGVHGEVWRVVEPWTVDVPEVTLAEVCDDPACGQCAS